MKKIIEPIKRISGARTRTVRKNDPSVPTDSSISNRVPSHGATDEKNWYFAVNPMLLVDFLSLASAWERGTSHLSSIAAKRRHPAYEQLKNLGSQIVPLALERMKTKSVFWFLLLEDLVDDPPKIESKDSMYETKKAWLAWARDRENANKN